MPIKPLIPKAKTEPNQDSLDSVETKLAGPETEANDPSRVRAVDQSEKKLAKLIKEEPAVRKVVKRSAQLAELMTDQDREDDLRVLR